MDSYKEYMVQKKKTMKDYLIRGVCVWIFLVLCMLSLFFVRDMFLRTIIFALTMALILACIYIIFPKTDIEYEYLYCDKTITVDAIYAKSKRKKMGEFELDRIDIICPVDSYRLDQFNTGKMEVVDYSSQMESDEHKPYAVLYAGIKKIILDLPEDFVKMVQNNAPRKVYFD